MSEEIKDKGGRPEKYTPEAIADLALKLGAYVEVTSFPVWAEFCYMNKIRRQLGSELCTKNEGFSDAYEGMFAKQEAYLNKVGVSGKGNSTFTAFLLKNNHGYKDKTEMALGGSAAFIEAILQRNREKKAKKAEVKNG